MLTEPLSLKNGYISINSFGFGGCNAHLLLKWNIKQKISNCAASDELPRLVALSGRTKESVNSFLNDVSIDIWKTILFLIIKTYYKYHSHFKKIVFAGR